MGLLNDQIKAMESGLDRLNQRIPDLPKTQILISRLLVHLGRELSNRVDLRLRPHGLTDIEFRTLMSVYTPLEEAANPTELCTGLGQSPANITRITDNLVARGLITRLPDVQDRRRLVLKTTPEGAQLIQTLLPLMLQSVQDSYRDFSPTELQQLLTSLKNLADIIDRENAAAPAAESAP
jgi:MarR family transcriptional repressor of emrRAB